MTNIDWITTADLTDDRIQATVDTEEAVTVAREVLNLEDAEYRVTSFLDALPELLRWFQANYRDFPWRRTQDSWEVIVAGILLQRTRAQAVETVYPEFLEAFPSPQVVYTADEDSIFEAVEMLGFGNRRTTTLIELATALVEDYDGDVPSDTDSLMELPRIGPYTARAYACFSRGVPLALIDANIETVVKRVFDYSSPVRAHKDQSLYEFLDALIPKDPRYARMFNLAFLDLRDAVCTDPPQCDVCPLNEGCVYVARSK